MNDSFPYTDLVLLALIAGFILLRLRSVLGQNAELPETMPKPVIKPEKPPEQLITKLADDDDEDASYIASSLSEGLAGKLKEVRRVDSSFRARAFLDGAKSAFEMIIAAFSQADRKTLKTLLAQDVFASFQSELNRRDAENIKVETTIISITGAEIMDASVSGNMIRIMVKFSSEQVQLTRNDEGAIIEGDPSEIEQVNDVWTFERDSRSSDPNWRLVATHS